MMDDLRVGGEEARTTKLAPTHAKVDILAVHEELRIKSTELSPKDSFHQKEAPGNDVDLPRGVALPIAKMSRIEYRHLWEESA